MESWIISIIDFEKGFTLTKRIFFLFSFVWKNGNFVVENYINLFFWHQIEQWQKYVSSIKRKYNKIELLSRYILSYPIITKKLFSWNWI